MDYLIGCRRLQGAGATPPLDETDAGTMWDTFTELERGGQALGVIGGREFASFSSARVLEQLANSGVVERLRAIAQTVGASVSGRRD